MKPHRLRAPSNDGALLAEPPLDQAEFLLDKNVQALDQWDHDFQGRSARRLRASSRQQVLGLARGYLGRFGLEVPSTPTGASPLILTGHQPELFHPGVWVKNFAADAVARVSGGVALNLVIDNDLVKSAGVRVPHREPSGLRVERVDYDGWVGQTPFEDLNVADEERFASFADRVRDVLDPAVVDPILDQFWPLALSQREKTRRVGLRFALARRALEGEWGVRNLEVPLSLVCESDGFLWFVSHILAHLARFQGVHNDALARYRSLYKIRSKHHPVPALTQEGEWREAPFWVWRSDEPRRRSLLVRQGAGVVALRIAGESETVLELPLGPDREACCAVERLLELPARKIRLRPRALTTTMFARLMLGDLFIHGIGGAKYDELGDEVIRGFFGIEPPGYLTLSLTLWPGLADEPASGQRLDAVKRAVRDLKFNPDRHFEGTVPPAAASAVERKRSAIAGPVTTHDERRARFAAIRAANETLQPWMNDLRHRLEVEQDRLANDVRRNAVAHSRDYAFILHSSRRTRQAMNRAVGGTPIAAMT
jgi:hypothetical protein